jgi:two-component system response regulator HydG
MRQKILIVEDQYIEANNLKRILKEEGYRVCRVARTVKEALTILDDDTPDMVLVDIRLDGELSGIELARSLNQRNMAFIYVSANSDRPTLEAAKSTRPYGFLVKPLRRKDLLVMLDVAWYLHQYRLGSHGQGRPPAYSPPDPEPAPEDKQIIGNSAAMAGILDLVKMVAPSDTSVLILGESGTGKEMVAQAIHRHSRRSSRPLIIVNCAALPSNLIESELFGHEKGSFTNALTKRIGKFEHADGGTIFLDEIGELPVDLQAKLLRVLQEREIEPIGGAKKKIDVRIIAATNRDLEEELVAGRFRTDLYYRLNVFPICLPPLRERIEDLPLLANHFLHLYAQKESKPITGLANHVLERMKEYSWPGNVRELENWIARSVLLTTGSIVNAVSLGTSKGNLPSDQPELAAKTMQEIEREHITSILEKCGGKFYGPGGAAEILKINPSTLKSRMKKLGIDKRITPSFRK